MAGEITQSSLGNVTINQNVGNKPEGIQEYCEAGFNLNHRNILKFNNGIFVEYPDQNNPNASIQSLPGKGEYDNKIVLTNLKNATIFGSSNSDDIQLEGCENCTVNVSKPDMRLDYVKITDSEDSASSGNVVYLSDESHGEGFVGDFVEIRHNGDKHFLSQNKLYAG